MKFFLLQPVLSAFERARASAARGRASGDNFNPHVTTGAGPQSYLDEMLAEPFEALSFSPTGASVNQLGTFGTAQKKLAALTLEP